MIFWITAAALTMAAIAALALPFLRAARSARSDADFDLEVYADQLGELDNEVKRGTLSADDAEQARAEISRRILKAKAESQERAAERPRAGLGVMAASLIAVPVIALSAYLTLGRPDMPAMPLAARLSKPPDQASITELVARAEKHLADNPDDGRGWEVIAPIYMRMERFDDAASAFRASVRLNGATPARLNGLGEALTIASGGIVTSDAHAAFEQSLQLQPGQPVARFYLATARGQQGDREGAATDLQALLDDSPADAPWRPAVQAALAGLGQAPPAAQPGPDADAMAAAAEMTPQERQDMIETMVASLSERLAENPDDLAGWQRLIQSYVVLGKMPEAIDATRRALAAFNDDETSRGTIEAFARSLSIDTGDGT